MSTPEIKALVFDVFGTVVDWRTSVARDVVAMAETKGWSVDAEAFADRWRSMYQPSMEPVRRGEMPYRRLDDLHRESLRTLIAEFGLKDLSQDEVEHLNRAWHRLTPWPDCVPASRRASNSGFCKDPCVTPRGPSPPRHGFSPRSDVSQRLK